MYVHCPRDRRYTLNAEPHCNAYLALLTLPHILLLLQLIAFDDEMDVAEVDHFTYYCDVYI